MPQGNHGQDHGLRRSALCCCTAQPCSSAAMRSPLLRPCVPRGSATASWRARSARCSVPPCSAARSPRVSSFSYQSAPHRAPLLDCWWCRHAPPSSPRVDGDHGFGGRENASASMTRAPLYERRGDGEGQAAEEPPPPSRRAPSSRRSHGRVPPSGVRPNSSSTPSPQRARLFFRPPRPPPCPAIPQSTRRVDSQPTHPPPIQEPLSHLPAPLLPSVPFPPRSLTALGAAACARPPPVATSSSRRRVPAARSLVRARRARDLDRRTADRRDSLGARTISRIEQGHALRALLDDVEGHLVDLDTYGAVARECGRQDLGGPPATRAHRSETGKPLASAPVETRVEGGRGSPAREDTARRDSSSRAIEPRAFINVVAAEATRVVAVGAAGPTLFRAERIATRALARDGERARNPAATHDEEALLCRSPRTARRRS